MEHRLITGGHEFLPFARSCITKLKRLGLPYANQSYEVGGVSIKVRIEPGHEYIRIDGGGVYMESGIQDLLSILPGVETTYRPAQVLLPPRVVKLVGPKLPNAKGRKIKSGAITWTATGGKASRLKNLVEVYLGSSGEPTVFTDPENVYCPDAVETAKAKALSYTVPPSVFTGKLHLFVQALYGSLRKDYMLPQEATASSPRLKLDTWETYADIHGEKHKIYRELLSTTPTSGLMTAISVTGATRYLLITIASTGVTFLKMKNGANGPTTFKKPPSLAEAEAYTLAVLVPSVEVQVATGPVVDSVAPGSPIAYGWHFNTAGDTAYIVMQEGKEISGVRAYDMTPSTIGGTHNTLYSMHLNYDFEDDSMSYTIESVQSGDHIPYIQTKVFVPDAAEGGMRLLMPGSPTPWNCYVALGPTPIYCYLDRADQLKVVTVRNATLTEVEAVINPTSTVDHMALFGTDVIADSIGVKVTLESYGGGYKYDGFGVDVGTNSVIGKSTIHTGGGGVDQLVLVADGSIVSQSGSTLIRSTRSSGSKSFVPILVVPFGCASSVIFGRQIDDHPGALTPASQYSFGNNVAIRLIDGTLPLWGSGGVMTWGLRSPLLLPSEIEALFPAVPPTRNIEMYLDSSAGGVHLKSYSGLISAVYSPYRALFFAGPNDPTYLTHMTVRTSYFGEMMHSNTTEHATIADNYVAGWPPKATTPTGWA